MWTLCTCRGRNNPKVHKNSSQKQKTFEHHCARHQHLQFPQTLNLQGKDSVYDNIQDIEISIRRDYEFIWMELGRISTTLMLSFSPLDTQGSSAILLHHCNENPPTTHPHAVCISHIRACNDLPKRSWNILKIPDRTKLTGKYSFRAPRSRSNSCCSTFFT